MLYDDWSINWNSYWKDPCQTCQSGLFGQTNENAHDLVQRLFDRGHFARVVIDDCVEEIALHEGERFAYCSDCIRPSFTVERKTLVDFA